VDVTDVALRVPATRRSVWRRTSIVVGLVIIAAVMVVWAAVQLRAELAANALQRDGDRSTGTIVGVDARRVGPRGQYVDGSVTVRYQAGGSAREAVVDVGADVTDQREGATVAIVVDPRDASRVALIDATPQYAGPPAVVLAGFGAISAVMAVLAARNLGRIRRAVGTEPWLFVRSGLRQVPVDEGSRWGSRTFVVLETPRGAVSVEPIGLNRVDPSFAPEAWVAGLDDATMALAPPGGGHVVAVRRRPVPTLVIDLDDPSVGHRGRPDED
jgi:hypothetical protein